MLPPPLDLETGACLECGRSWVPGTGYVSFGSTWISCHCSTPEGEQRCREAAKRILEVREAALDSPVGEIRKEEDQ